MKVDECIIGQRVEVPTPIEAISDRTLYVAGQIAGTPYQNPKNKLYYCAVHLDNGRTKDFPLSRLSLCKS